IWVVHLSNSLDKQRSSNRSQNAIVSILSDCKMTPAQGASARVCIAPTRKAVLAVDNLEPAGPGKTYEAWVIAGRRVQPAELYRRFGRLAYGLAFRILRDDALAQDAVQDAFLGVWRAAGRFTAERSKPSTWLLTLVHRRAVDLVRREERRRTEPLQPESE